ncbi:MAG: aspartate--tRNA ligase [Solirubrobacteraceae bacterium]
MSPPRANAFRDTWAGDPRSADDGSQARVAGWVHRRRDHGGLIFIDLRDGSGILQLVFHPETAGDAHAAAHALRSEDVISVTGTIACRAAENVNAEMPTGEVEVAVTALDKLADAETPPFPVDEDGPVDEAIRLRHRVVDLRRSRPHRTIALRHRVTRTMRSSLDALGFLEIETPMLTRSTPEGARDFLVPSRLNQGSFFALPQSPQLFKQLLMVAGFERYFQIVRCFRDEDPRADRQPEFTQLDLEMSFVDEEDVIGVMEHVMADVFAATDFPVAPPPWPRMSYDEALARYGVDRPDVRFGLEIQDVSEALAGSEFKVFSGALASGGVVRAINAGARELPRAQLDALTERAQANGAKGLVWAFVEEGGGWRSPIAKFLSEAEIAALNARLEANPGDALFAVADAPEVAARVLGDLRLELGERFDLIPTDEHALAWIVDFPMFEDAGGRWDPLHHPFTAPTGDLEDPGALRSRAYDLVLDGFEIGGGSIRTSDPAVLRRVLELIGIGPDEAQARFGFLLDALRYGAPPHGGIAMGLDRIVAMLAGWRNAREVNIREAIAFPKTASGLDPLTGAPAPVNEDQLRDLGLVVRRPPGEAGGNRAG